MGHGVEKHKDTTCVCEGLSTCNRKRCRAKHSRRDEAHHGASLLWLSQKYIDGAQHVTTMMDAQFASMRPETTHVPCTGGMSITYSSLPEHGSNADSCGVTPDSMHNVLHRGLQSNTQTRQPRVNEHPHQAPFQPLRSGAGGGHRRLWPAEIAAAPPTARPPRPMRQRSSSASIDTAAFLRSRPKVPVRLGERRTRPPSVAEGMEKRKAAEGMV